MKLSTSYKHSSFIFTNLQLLGAGNGLSRIRLLYSSSKLNLPVLKSNTEQSNQGQDKSKCGFAFAKHGDFVQAEPQHQNSWTSDGFLQSYFKLNLPKEIFNQIEPDLTRFGGRCADDIWKLGRECEENPPYLRQTTAWGKRVDDIITCNAWKEQKRISAVEGLIAIPYENKQGEFSRLYQCAKLYMYSPSSGLYSCPLAMTDGAAKTIHSLKLPLEEAWEHLISRNPDQFWTSGQWMTEKRGGSDVGSGTETLAFHQETGLFNLHGYKWFSSATDSNMVLTLARIVDDQDGATKGSRGLSMFYLKLRNDDGQLNNIQVVKMKNKLGTRQLPTAELLLDGTTAELVSEEGRGIASISSMLTVTRLHNTISSVGAMRKILSLARDYATRRTAFGARIDSLPLHIQTLYRMEIETRGCCILMLDLARQMGQHDTNTINDQDLLLMRLMTPVAKFYTGKMAVSVISEGLECFGGQGYIEDTGLPSMLRDAQVLPIWEGTSSLMSLDVVRAITKTRGEVLRAFSARVNNIVDKVEEHSKLSKPGLLLKDTVAKMLRLLSEQPQILEQCGRDLAVTLAHTYISALLLEHAHRSGDEVDVDVAVGWFERDLAPILRNKDFYSKPETQKQKSIVYQNYEE
ncbi:acyl-CoA dehydrogenase family member 11 [Eurytemora carolleeae]|uniref:acyl-CoA dehydrogenase family member 11 n=1 Tax=Eurytemora carolleeae TaxID=1294199 RepID=UPI000C762DCF|nr:acyl-CoA dehydrogenase family member 11 [Eurytemora carolleeae]|eukprot:XP_023332760.1 acyl-CoA dehydrogenase family member 11-like [Eurytemora affinis]